MAIIGKLGPMGRGGSLGLSGRVRPGRPGFMGHPGQFGAPGVNEGHLHSPSFRPPGPYNVQGGPVQRPGAHEVAQAVHNAPAPPGGGGSGAPQPYYDATAMNSIAQYLAGVNQRVSGLQRNSSQAFTNYANTMGNLDYQQPRAQLTQMQNANRSGGLYSSAENQAQANILHNFLDARSSALGNLGNVWTNNQASIAGLQGGVPNFEAGQSLAATQRRSAAAAKFPAAGEGTGALVRAVAHILAGKNSGRGGRPGVVAGGKSNGQSHHMPAGKPSGRPAKPPKAPPRGGHGHGYTSGGAGL